MSKNTPPPPSSSSKQPKLGSSSSSSSYSSSSYSSGSSGSSIAELFELPSSSPPNSSSIFGSVFGPPSMGTVRSSHVGNAKHGSYGIGGQAKKGETIDQPCYYSSSILYGGQEVYSPATQPTESHITFKKDDQDDPNSASRGNWWRGSLYY